MPGQLDDNNLPAPDDADNHTQPPNGTDTGTGAGTGTGDTEDSDEDVLEATRKGWVPREEYTGDPKRWVDAKTFLDRGRKFNSNLQREVETLKQKLAEFEGTKKQFIKFHQETLAAKQRELDAAITELRVQRSRATGEGDHEQAVALEDRIELLKDQRKELDNEAKAIDTVEGKPEPADKSAAALARANQNAAVQAWVEDGNDWFVNNKMLRDHAVAVTEEMLQEGETARGRKLLDKVAARVRDDFPRHFAQQNREPNSTVESGDTRTGKAVKRSKADLPAADRKIMESLVREGYTTEEKFLESYFSR